MAKVIIVQNKGSKVEGAVTEKTNIKPINADDLEAILQSGMAEVSDVLSGVMDDPTMKKCSRCVKMGRMPYHPIEQFSMLQNGKRLSQCKVCRTEQSREWEERKREHRAAYHREYNKTRIPANRVPTALKEFITAMDAQADDTIDTKEALFVAMADDDVEVT